MVKPLLHLLRTALNDSDERESLPIGFVDDASRLNQTRVAEVCSFSGVQDHPEEQLRTHLQHARVSNLPLSIAGTRHTMGGQTFTPDGMILDMLGLHEMHLDEQSNILHVQAGAKVGVQVETTVIRAAPYQEMLSRIEVLEALIAELPKQQRRIGHNVRPITDEDVQEIRQAVAILKAQPVVPDKAKAAGSTLKSNPE